jgi:hypothetical protein
VFDLYFGDSIDDDDVENRMEADLEDESKTYSYDDGNEKSQGKGSCGSLKEGVHEGRINESNEEGNVGGTSFQGKDSWEW